MTVSTNGPPYAFHPETHVPTKLPTGVSEIRGAKQIMHLRQLLNSMVDYPAQVRLDFVTSQHWAVCPVVDQPELDDFERICSAAATYRNERCFVVPTESRSFAVAYEVQMRADTLQEIFLWEHLSLSNLVLTPGDGKFLVMKEAADYFLVAGERPFVERAISVPLSVARELFDRASAEIAADSRYLQLAPIGDRYRKFNG